MDSFDVICLGDATIDVFLPLNSNDQNYKLNEKEIIFNLGDKFLVDGYKLFLGGIASNVAVGLSRLNKKVALVTELGEDDLSETIIKKLKNENVNTDLIVVSKKSQTTLSVVVSSQEKHILFLAHNEKGHEFSFGGSNAPWLFLTELGNKWENASEDALNLVKEKSMRVAFAPGISQIQRGKDALINVFQNSELIFLNKTEAQEILNSSQDIDDLLKSIKALGPKTIIITDGDRGSFVLDSSSKTYHQEIVQSNVVETTGAGDAYISGFMAAYIEEKPIQECMRWGVLNSSSVIEHIGAQEGLLTFDEMQKRTLNKW